MPLRAAVPHVVRHHIVYNRAGEFCTNVIHVEHSATPTEAMVDADRDVIVTWLNAYWRAQSASSVSAYYLKAWSMETVPPTKFNDRGLYPSAPIAGTGGNTVVPFQLCWAASLRTGAAGSAAKPLHGVIYHAGGHQQGNLQADGNLTAGANTAYLAAYDALRVALNYTGNIGRWVVVSFVDGGTRTAKVWRAAPVVAPVTHLLSSQTLRTQRRRAVKQRAYTVN